MWGMWRHQVAPAKIPEKCQEKPSRTVALIVLMLGSV